MKSPVTQRFISCVKHLVAENQVRSARQFAIGLNYKPQGLSEIFHSKREVPLKLLTAAIEKYNLNPRYIFSGDGPMIAEGHGSELQILTIVEDETQQERIIHVPIPAQAGYAAQYMDPVFVGELPTYALPDRQFRSGTYRSFDVAGDSMEPTLYNADKVICSFIEPSYWQHAVKDQAIYVVITIGDVLVKRVLNRIRENKALILVSDNAFYDPFPVPVEEIREIWRVRLRLTAHLGEPLGSDKLSTLEKQLEEQNRHIEKLNETIRMLVTSETHNHHQSDHG